MEMAGKENRIEYIMEHHAEFMKKHEELLAALAENSFIYPDGCPDSGSEASGEEAGEDGDTGNTDTGQVLQETDEQTLNGQIALLQEQLDNFESDGIEDILKQLESCTYHGINLNEITAKIRQSVDEFDFLGAGGVLEELKEKITGSQNGGNHD